MTRPSASAPSIPRSPADVTPHWLSSVLRVGVESVDVTPIGTGQTGATYRLSVTYSAEQTAFPSAFAVKLSSQDDLLRRWRLRPAAGRHGAGDPR
jgi:hypothetical protein